MESILPCLFAYFMCFRHLPGTAGRELPLSQRLPLWRAVCNHRESKAQKWKQRRWGEKEKAQTFELTAPECFCLLELDWVAVIFLSFSLQTQIYQLCSAIVACKGSDPWALHPLIPKTLLPLSPLLFSYVDWSAACVSEGGSPAPRSPT